MRFASRLRHRILFVALLLVPLLGRAEQGPPDLDGWVERTRAEFNVPGIAVAVVRDGAVVFSRGYGQRRAGGPERVDGDTLFGIASNTKAFTTAALSILADEGRLSWDDPVSRHLPGFAMHDPYVSREITLRDLVSHRAGLGLGAGDLLWWPSSDVAREEIVARVRHVPPAAGFRSRYHYNNVLYVVAGEVVEAVSGRSWDAFLQQRIFDPLGMRRTAASVAALRAGDNVATPHAIVDGTLTALDFWSFDNVGAAASINSTANDLARWANVQLAGGAIPASGGSSGEPGGSRRLFSERMQREMWSPQIFVPIWDPHPALAATKPTWSAYGLGWMLGDYRGHRLVSHSGALPGYFSRVVLVPERKLGIVVLTNQEAPEAFQSVALRLLDHYLAAAPTDWIAAYRQSHDASLAREAAATRRDAERRAAGTSPSLPLDGYAGTYRDAWYGDVRVRHEGGRLVLRFTRTPALTGDLEHWHHDTFAVRWRERALNSQAMRGDAWITFSLGRDGAVREASMAPISPRTDFSFDYEDLRLVRQR